MQSTLCEAPPHSNLAAVMDAADLAALPGLVKACRDLTVDSLTVYTLPPDLRLAALMQATGLVDALVGAVEALDGVQPRLAGRRFYLPEHLVRLSAGASPSGFELRIAVDYASKPAFLNAGATLALVPDGLEFGNLLRWHLAGTPKVRVDWRYAGAEDLASLLYDLPATTVPFRASTQPARLRRPWN